MLTLSETGIHSLYQPQKCERRMFLRHSGAEESAGPYEEMLQRMGAKYEKDHLKELPSFVDLGKGTRNERVRATVENINSATPALYHPLIIALTTLDDQECEIAGRQRFLEWGNIFN